MKVSESCIQTHPTAQTLRLGETPINLSAISRAKKIDQGYLSRILSKQSKPSIEVATKIADAVGMGLEEFLQSLPAKKSQ